MAENIYNWQFNTIPGTANQGAVLMTRNDITQPPFNQTDFVWKAMEDVFGVSNVRIDYDEEHNLYKFYKAKGHLDNDNNWSYTWEQVGEWEALTPEVVEALKQLIYVSYRFDQTTVDDITTLKMYGKKKDGTEDLIVTITFVTKQYVDEALRNVKRILTQAPLTATDSGNDRTLGLNYNTDDFTINNNALKANIINDTLTTSRIKTWSIDEIKDYVKIKWQYKGEVQDKSTLPDNADQGSVYGVINEADMYVNISNTSIPTWKAFTEIAESFNAYAIELHKGTNGLYGKLRYDTVDFMIDQFYNLKSQLIDDTIDASSPLANRKVYSIDKILQLLSSMFVYKGQVDYYDQLTTTGNKIGDSYNVKYVGTSTQASTELDGDNYAWNGTSWDDLSGEYRAGAGIVINGKVISATGISFIVGDGLQATGSGSTTTLSTRITDGLQRVNVGTTADPIYADGVKAGNAITVNSNGVNVNTGYTTKTVNNNIEVDYAEGLGVNASNKLIVNTNFVNIPTPLGNNPSGLSLYSDDKIGLDLSGIRMKGEIILRQEFPANTNYITNVQIPNYGNYDMFLYELFLKRTSVAGDDALVSSLALKGNNTVFTTGINNNSYAEEQRLTPTGMLVMMLYLNNISSTGLIGRASSWRIDNWVASSTAWNPYRGDGTNFQVGFKVYGIKLNVQ